MNQNMAQESEGFLQRLLAIFIKGSDPGREKKRLLKEIGKELKRKKHKFYKPKSSEALPNLAKYFYELYKVVNVAQVLLEKADDSAVLKTIIIDNALTDKQKQLKEAFDESEIRKRAEVVDTKTLANELKDKMVSFFSAFDAEKVKEINGRYNLLLIFLGLVKYDYYFLLKKFDSGFPERDFNYNPKFETINGDYISDDLKDYLEVAPLIKRDADWEGLFEILKYYKTTEVVNLQSWKKVVKIVNDTAKNRIFELIVCHIEKDPYYKPKIVQPNEKIVEEYLNKLKTTSEITIQKILKERQTKQIDKLLTLIFGTTAVSRMKYYTEKANLSFSKKMLGGFIYVDPLNYLKAFLLDYFKRDIKALADILLIRGKWSTNITSQQFSDAYHTVMQAADDLLHFDESLSEEGEKGAKLKNMALRAERDKDCQNMLRKMLKEENEQAMRIIQTAVQNLIVVGKHLKGLLEDYEKKPHELIMNWKELENASEKDLKASVTEAYKKIYYFVQLLQFYSKKGT